MGLVFLSWFFQSKQSVLHSSQQHWQDALDQIVWNNPSVSDYEWILIDIKVTENQAGLLNWGKLPNRGENTVF